MKTVNSKILKKQVVINLELIKGGVLAAPTPPPPATTTSSTQTNPLYTPMGTK